MGRVILVRIVTSLKQFAEWFLQFTNVRSSEDFIISLVTLPFPGAFLFSSFVIVCLSFLIVISPFNESKFSKFSLSLGCFVVGYVSFVIILYSVYLSLVLGAKFHRWNVYQNCCLSFALKNLQKHHYLKTARF